MLKPPNAGEYVPNVKFKTAGRYSLTERPPWDWASLGLGLSDAHTAHLAFAGKGVRPCPFSLALCPTALWREPRGARDGPLWRGKRGRPRGGARRPALLSI